MWRRCVKKEKTGKTLTIKVRFSDFTTITRSSTHEKDFTEYDIQMMSKKLLPIDDMRKRGVRLMGVTMSNFQSDDDDDNELYKQLKIKFDWDLI